MNDSLVNFTLLTLASDTIHTKNGCVFGKALVHTSTGYLAQRCTNADLKISLFVCFHIKKIPCKFRIFYPKGSWASIWPQNLFHISPKMAIFPRKSYQDLLKRHDKALLTIVYLIPCHTCWDFQKSVFLDILW